uniref:Reverse transcriptase domain-containing protein n=1 Tax=Lactuca sativa TaxID=4236 RepID=A0A9R1X5R7_LACSA|nr:hypothetical protein LSAT_V11C600337540 [Lactuca sativa]
MMQAIKLEAPFSHKEVKDAVWACGSEKAPGPDGLTFKFIKTYWEIIKDDVMKFVFHFDKFGTFARGFNSTFISLVPKVKDPISLTDYRPISFMGCMSKIISKILATRIKSVIGDLIGDVQSAYVEGRSILDGPLMINELISWSKVAKRKILMFKVDFDKAFDSIN